ncbi:GNAT family N-acetyltransferase [Paracoccaceae bacterium]|nr:GNAT family N-acetyltransferase [Paracoccaceae bacterium]
MDMMKIRLAEKHDCLDLWKWRNDIKTILTTPSQSPVTYSEHLKWFNKAFNDSNSVIFIGYHQKEKKKFGMIRFDKRNKNLTEVSINLSPRFRGKRLSEKFLNRTLNAVSASNPQFIISAKVMIGNFVSKKLFKKCGFVVKSIKNRTVYFNYKTH